MDPTPIIIGLVALLGLRKRTGGDSSASTTATLPAVSPKIATDTVPVKKSVGGSPGEVREMVREDTAPVGDPMSVFLEGYGKIADVDPSGKVVMRRAGPGHWERWEFLSTGAGSITWLWVSDYPGVTP